MGPIRLADWQGAGAGIKAGSLLPTTNTALFPGKRLIMASHHPEEWRSLHHCGRRRKGHLSWGQAAPGRDQSHGLRWRVREELEQGREGREDRRTSTTPFPEGWQPGEVESFRGLSEI